MNHDYFELVIASRIGEQSISESDASKITQERRVCFVLSCFVLFSLGRRNVSKSANEALAANKPSALCVD